MSPGLGIPPGSQTLLCTDRQTEKVQNGVAGGKENFTSGSPEAKS